MSHGTEATPATGPTRPLPTPGFLDRQLARSMDATALNLEQHNPDPGPNSIFEFMGIEIEQLEEGPRKQRLTVLLAQAVEINGVEGGMNRQISGDLDQATAEVRAIVATGETKRPPNVHQLRQLLNRPLSILADPAGRTPKELADAGVEVDRLIASNSADRVFSATLLYNLGKKKAAVLLRRADR